MGCGHCLLFLQKPQNATFKLYPVLPYFVNTFSTLKCLIFLVFWVSLGIKKPADFVSAGLINGYTVNVYVLPFSMGMRASPFTSVPPSQSVNAV